MAQQLAQLAQLERQTADEGQGMSISLMLCDVSPSPAVLFSSMTERDLPGSLHTYIFNQSSHSGDDAALWCLHQATTLAVYSKVAIVPAALDAASTADADLHAMWQWLSGLSGRISAQHQDGMAIVHTHDGRGACAYGGTSRAILSTLQSLIKANAAQGKSATRWLSCGDSNEQQPKQRVDKASTEKSEQPTGAHRTHLIATGIDYGERRLSDSLGNWLEKELGSNSRGRSALHERDLRVFSELYSNLSTQFHKELRQSIQRDVDTKDAGNTAGNSAGKRKHNLGPDLKYVAGLADGGSRRAGSASNKRAAMPSISVVSSVYRKPAIVEIQALLLRWQHYPSTHFETVICDDGSVPPALPTGEALPDVYLWHSKSRPPLEMAAADQILRLTHGAYDGGGPWTGRTNHKIRSQNHCVFLARHPQLVLLDDDVWPFSEQWALAFASRMKNHAQVVVRGECDFYRIDPAHPGIEMDAHHYYSRKQDNRGEETTQNTFARFGSYRWFKHNQADLGYFFPHNVGISKRTFEAVGGMDFAFDGTYAWEDLDFGNKLKEQGVIPKRQVLLSYEGYAVNVGWPHHGVLEGAQKGGGMKQARVTVAADGTAPLVTEQPKANQRNQRNERIYQHRWLTGRPQRSVVVSRVLADSAAAKAGMSFGDIMYVHSITVRFREF
jgi:hypothetical protein